MESLNKAKQIFVKLHIKNSTMALGWNEIKDRAVKFAREWTDTSNEEADAQAVLDARAVFQNPSRDSIPHRDRDGIPKD